MTLTDSDRELVRRIVEAIRRGRVEELADEGIESRLTDAEVHQAVADYGRTLLPITDEVLAESEVYEVDADPPGRDVVVPMRTREEGRSDLSLDVFIGNASGKVRAVIKDIHVP